MCRLRRSTCSLSMTILEDGFHPHGHLDGVFGEAEVEDIFPLLSRRGRGGLTKQGIELEADEGTFGDDGAVLLLDREEMLVGLAVGEDDCLTTEGTNLRATDVEHIAMAGQIGQGDVVALCHQTIAQPGPVDIEWNVVLLAHLIYII